MRETEEKERDLRDRGERLSKRQRLRETWRRKRARETETERVRGERMRDRD